MPRIKSTIQSGPVIRSTISTAGAVGPRGEVGPNEVTGNTASPLQGVLVADGERIREAMPGEVINASDMQAALAPIESAIDDLESGKSDVGHTHSNATTSASGFMSSSDKTKLDGVATGANNYSHPTQAAIDGNATDNGISVVDRVQVNTLGHVTAVSTRNLSEATTSAAGVMSAADKTKLNGVATGATANSADATLLARANHTGTQAISTITNLQTTLDGKAPMVHTHAAATTSVDGFMSSADKLLLNAIAENFPIFTQQPQSLEVYESQNATFTVDTNIGTDVQWQQSTDGTTWDDIPGATSSVYTKTATVHATDNGLKIRSIAAKNGVTVYSDVATLSVWTPDSFGASLVAWWNPRAGKYTERTGLSATTVAGNGDPVGTWIASNGTHYLYAASDSARPTVNSAGMSFYVDDALRYSEQLFRKTGLAYLFFAIEVSVAPDQATLFCDRTSNNDSSRRVIINMRHSGEFRTRLFTRTSDSEASGTAVFAPAVYTYEERFVLIAELNWQEGRTAIWKNNTKLAETTIPIAGETDDTNGVGAYLGSNFNAGYFDWNCFDHAILKPSEPLSQIEREKLVEFMLVRMGAA